MDNLATPIEALFEKAEDYGKTSIELLRLTTIEKTADVVSTIANRLSLILLISMFTIMLNIALALLIGEMLGTAYYGFLVMGAFYMVATCFIYIFGEDWIQKPVNNALIIIMLKLK